MTTRRVSADDPAGEFVPPVEHQHRRIDPDEWNDIYIVGDIHGCREAFEWLLDVLEVGSEDLVVCVGDLVRKGPDSAGVVDLVRDRENIISVRGNNEQKLIDGRKTVPSLSEDDLSFLSSLPLTISWDETLVVHGGLDPERPVPDHDVDTLLTMRSHRGNGYDGPFWFDVYEGSPRVFFGHTVLDEPVDRQWAVGLDTGCVYGGSLTAYDCSRDRFVSVDAPECHRSRPDEKFLSHSACRM